MITIWKYTLPLEVTYSIKMPKHARVLCVQSQFNDPTIWVCVDDTNEPETRTFKLYGTGYDITESYMNRKYIGTVQLYDGNNVYHLYEINPKAVTEML